MTDRLEELFVRQRTLAARFHVIEEENNLLEYVGMPVEITDRHGQARLRALMWRVVEEIGEFLDELDSRSPISAAREELADVLHFLIELYLSAGITAADLLQRNSGECPWAKDELERSFLLFESLTSTPRGLILKLILSLTSASHELKARPWKKDPKPTDLEKFRYKLVSTFEAYIRLCDSCEMDADLLYNSFLNKETKNHARIDGGA